MKSTFVISDLHLFSQRTRAAEVMNELHARCADASDLVLLGDIFDFKWSTVGSAEATAEAAQQWLRVLIERYPQCQFHFLLGNHDHHSLLMDRLVELAAEHANFAWQPYYLRIGDALFLHGDAANPGLQVADLPKLRAHLETARRPGRLRTRLYDVVLACQLHRPLMSLLFPTARVMRRLARYLCFVGERGVKHVYFGHTHRAVAGREYAGMTFHNGGAPLPGSSFAIVEAQLS